MFSLQESGLAGIVLKYSVASTPYNPAADHAVVPSKWLTHLPPGYFPGLAVQVCACRGTTAETMAIALDSSPIQPEHVGLWCNVSAYEYRPSLW